jgi:hypothetical protein
MLRTKKEGQVQQDAPQEDIIEGISHNSVRSRKLARPRQRSAHLVRSSTR